MENIRMQCTYKKVSTVLRTLSFCYIYTHTESNVNIVQIMAESLKAMVPEVEPLSLKRTPCENKKPPMRNKGYGSVAFPGVYYMADALQSAWGSGVSSATYKTCV